MIRPLLLQLILLLIMKTAGSCSDRLTSAGLQWCIENVNAFYFVSLTHFGSISNKYRHVNQLNSSVCLVDYLSAVQLRQLFCCLLRETMLLLFSSDITWIAHHQRDVHSWIRLCCTSNIWCNWKKLDFLFFVTAEPWQVQGIRNKRYI